MKNKYIFGIIITFVVLLVIANCLAWFTSLAYLESFRIVFGSVYVLFIPGFIISYIFFPKTKEFDSETKSKEVKGNLKSKSKEPEKDNSIDWIERIALSFALSIAIVPLAVFYLNLIGVKINLLNSFLTILGIIIISAIILRFRMKKL